MRRPQLLTAHYFTTLRAHWLTLQDEPSRVGVCLASQALSALLQVSAILMLMPLFQASSGRKASIAWLSEIESFFARAGSAGFVLASVGSFAGLGLLATVAKFVADRQGVRLRLDIEQRLRDRMLDAIAVQPWDRFADLRVGTLSRTMSGDCGRYADASEKIVRGASALLAAAILFVSTMMVAPASSTLAVGLIVVGMIGARLLYRKMGGDAKQRAAAGKRAMNALVETMSNWKYLKSIGLARPAIDHVRTTFDEFDAMQIKVLGAAIRQHSIVEVGALLVVSAYLAFGLLSGYGMGELVVMVGIFTRIAPQILAAQRAYNSAKEQQHAVVSWTTLYEEVTLTKELEQGTVAPRFERTLELRGVEFRYAEANSPTLLSGVDVVLARGSSLAVVGPSGSGKSTLIDVVTGLLAPSGGGVLLDGVPLADVDVMAWRTHIGFVSQSCPLFYGTIAENIAFGAAKSDRTKIAAAATLAGVTAFTDQLTAGLDTPVGEAGCKLSGGQRQRVAIARALYRDPWLLIFDEPTSALDRESEADFIATFTRLRGRYTTLLITHNERVVAAADQVRELRDGRLRPYSAPAV